MAVSRVSPLPLAFLLALASDANASSPASLPEAGQRLEAGMLANLFERSIAEFTIKSIEQMKGSEQTTIVQYFPNFPNFRNCFSGYWRNC